jgi:hypothetical protein
MEVTATELALRVRFFEAGLLDVGENRDAKTALKIGVSSFFRSFFCVVQLGHSKGVPSMRRLATLPFLPAASRGGTGWTGVEAACI